jgi:hypothetical protein
MPAGNVATVAMRNGWNAGMAISASEITTTISGIGHRGRSACPTWSAANAARPERERRRVDVVEMARHAC